MRFHSATLKLTLFYVLIAMAISVSFSFALFNISSKELGRGLGRQTGLMRDLPMERFQGGFVPNFEELRVQQLDESNGRLRDNLIYFNVLILLLSSGAGYFLARKTLEPIEEAVEAQNHFTADASHELRTPLTAMKTEIEVAMRDKKLNLDQAKVLLKSNLDEIGKLESLSNALLKLSRYQNESRTDFRKLSLSRLVVEAYQKVEPLAEEKNISFDNDLNDVSILGDKQSLVELFVILLDNAIKYSPNNSTIVIKINSTDDHVIATIKDYGAGIKASDLPFIFNRFYRADNSRSKGKISGYGLGLSIAKRIVELHNGKISVISRPGKGSQFTLKFKAYKI